MTRICKSTHNCFNSYILFFIGILPFLSLVCWHYLNQKFPNDDAASYATTSVQLHQYFLNNGFLTGLREMYMFRGWRPTTFSPLAVPFLFLFNGNIVHAAGGVLCLSFAVFTVYIYLYFRLYLRRAASVVCANFIVTLPWFYHYSLIFFSEITMLAVLVAAAYHIQRSRQCSYVHHCIVAGLALGVALTIRPEAILVPFIIFVCLTVDGLRKRTLSKTDIAFGLVAVLFLFGVLGRRFFYHEETFIKPLLIFVAGMIFFSLCVGFNVLRVNRRAAVFLITLLLVVGIWYMPFVKETYDWVRATSVGVNMKLYKGFGALNLLSSFRYNLGGIGGLQLCVIFGIAASSVVFSFRKNKLSLPGLQEAILGIIALGIVVFGTVVSQGSDIRRAFVGGCILFVGLLILALNPLVKGYYIRLACVGLIASLQLIVAVMPVFQVGRKPRELAITRLGSYYHEPYKKEDPSMLTMLELQKYVSPGSSISLHTLSINSYKDRIFDLEGLILAGVLRQSNIRIGYPGLFNTLDEGYRLMKTLRYTHILLDTRIAFIPDIPKNKMDEPYMRLTMDLIHRAQNNSMEDLGWKQVASITVNNTPFYIFKNILEPDWDISGPDVPMLIKSINKYNIVVFRGVYYGIPQFLGPIDLAKTDVVGKPGVVTAKILDEVESFINSKKTSAVTSVKPRAIEQQKQFGWQDAMDGNLNTFWEEVGPYSHWIQINYDAGVRIAKYSMQTGGHGTDATDRMPTDWKLQGSNDGVTWVDLDTQIDQKNWKNNEKRYFDIVMPAIYKYYRLYCIAGGNPNIIRLSEIELLQ